MTVTATDAQFQDARLELRPGLTAHSLLLRAVDDHALSQSSERVHRLRSRLTDEQAQAVRVMLAGGGTFSPSFAVPSDVGTSRRLGDWREEMIDADTTRLHAVLTAAFPAGLPSPWRRVLDDTRPWLIDLANAHAAIGADIGRLWGRAQPLLTREHIRFEVSRESPTASRSYALGRDPLRVGESSISLPWPTAIKREFTGDMTYTPLLANRGVGWLLLHDRGHDKDVDATVGFSLNQREPSTTARTDHGDKIEVLLGAPRASILRNVATPLSMGDLSVTLNYSPATMTHHVKRLEAAGLVRVDRQGGLAWVTRSVRGELLLAVMS